MIKKHSEGDRLQPLYMSILGTAGTGKSYLIKALKNMLGNALKVTATTGLAAFNIDGETVHSALSLPVKRRSE